MSFVVIKATEGMGYDDAEYRQHRAEAEAAGKLIGTYHYGWGAQDPIIEADHYIRVAAPKVGEIVALDLEREKDAESWATRVAFALKWMGRVKAVTGAVPWLYVNGYWARSLKAACTPDQWAELSTYPLWLANPNGTPGTFPTPEGWTVVAHQYLWKPLLLDWFGGGRAEWAKYAVKNAAA